MRLCELQPTQLMAVPKDDINATQACTVGVDAPMGLEVIHTFPVLSCRLKMQLLRL
jgi:hypothetical protein